MCCLCLMFCSELVLLAYLSPCKHDYLCGEFAFALDYLVNLCFWVVGLLPVVILIFMM
jgi:hypothetical protein